MTEKWKVKKADGSVYGPADTDTMRKWIKDDRVLAEDLISPEDKENWREAKSLLEFADLFGTKTSLEKEKKAEKEKSPLVSGGNYCPNCGKKIDKGVKFCPSCGNPISIVDKGKTKEVSVLGEPKPKRSSGKDRERKELKNAKTLGGTGAILSFLGVIPVIGWILSLTGIVLVFIAVKKIANITKTPQIFKDYVKAVIFSLIALPISLLVIAPSLVRGLRLLDQGIETGVGRMLSGGVIFGFLVLIGALICCGYFLRKSFTVIADKTGVSAFKIAGNIYFISSILTIILVGFIGFFIEIIFRIIAFFSLPEELPERSE